MTRQQAIRLAVKALEAQRHRVAPEAKAYELYGARSPDHVRAAKQYAELGAAIELLKRDA